MVRSKRCRFNFYFNLFCLHNVQLCMCLSNVLIVNFCSCLNYIFLVILAKEQSELTKDCPIKLHNKTSAISINIKSSSPVSSPGSPKSPGSPTSPKSPGSPGRTSSGITSNTSISPSEEKSVVTRKVNLYIFLRIFLKLKTRFNVWVCCTLQLPPLNTFIHGLHVCIISELSLFHLNSFLSLLVI